MTEKKKIVLVSVATGVASLAIGGLLGYKIGFKSGWNIGWEEICYCVENGALHILDEAGKRIEIEDLKKLTIIWD